MTTTMEERDTSNDIAIIGMSGRFPGAHNISALWKNLVSGTESVATLSAEDLRRAGVPESLLDDPHYVPRKGVIEGVDLFDAGFFSYSPREAEAIDPQQRIMLECAWSALEDAGYDPHGCPSATGVFVGCNMNTYLLFNLAGSEAALANVHALGIASEKDFLATRVSHKLNLRGPSLSVQCACSTSLVCVHLACQSLLSGESEMALAGGVSVTFPQAGYYYEEGGVFSPDGHCRTFDQNAAGTLSGDGVAVVVLKRYQDALRDRDHIYARIVGSAINNDGLQKASFAAPTVNGQMQVICEALGVARLEPKDIGYVETHGTGTPFGDSIELAALSRVFTAGGVAPHGCMIGALKPNVGHLDQAAGVANIVKAALALCHEQIPPTINIRKLNPELQTPTTPLQVARTLTSWRRTSTPRRAGVSSFGFGGTNAHVILEEAPLEERPASQHWQILPFSAKTGAALDASINQLQRHFAQHGEIPLRDAAFVLQEGRGRYPHGGFVVARSSEAAAEILERRDPKGLVCGVKEGSSSIYFLFPGQGAQFPNMGKDLYEIRPAFRRHIDQAAGLVHDLLGLDLRELLFPDSADRDAAQARLNQTRFTQPCLFAIEYALARLWMECGVMPEAMLGHSLGEYVAACLAGVFRLEDALRLVALRGALIQELPPGDMISVQAPAEKVRRVVENSVSIAAINAPNFCTLSGDPEAIRVAAEKLAEHGYAYQKLHTSHAFHSGMMDAILDRFEQAVEAVERNAPLIPFVSNITGKMIKDDEAMDPAYWRRHLRGSVLFADGAAMLLKAGRGTFIEVGPGQTLTSLLTQQRQYAASEHTTINSIGTAKANISHELAFLNAVGRVWLQGHTIEWEKVRHETDVRRVPLPTYPFEGVRYLAEPRSVTADATVKASSTERKPLDRWMYLPTWTRTPLCASTPGIFKNRACLLLTDDAAFSRAFQDSARDLDLVWARSGEHFEQEADGAFVVRPDCSEDLQNLIIQATAGGRALTDVIVGWSMGRGVTVCGSPSASTESIAAERLIKVLNAIAVSNPSLDSLRLTVLTSGAQDVSPTESIVTADAALLGLCKVIPQEYPQIQCKNIDFASGLNVELAASQLAEELAANDAHTTIAYRGRVRFREVYTPLSQTKAIEPVETLQQNGVVLITGGLGEVGLTLAEYFAERYSARLCLVGRTALPRPEAWDAWLQVHPQNDSFGKVIPRLQRMLQAGIEIEFATADVSDRDEMKTAFDAARKRFGQIDCVVHAAGVSGSDTFCGLRQTSTEVLARHFRAKVDGLRVLEDLVREEPGLRLVILQSSLFGVLGGGGCGAYAAATVFMDRVAARHGQEQNTTRWISIAWDGWAPEEKSEQAMDQFAIRPSEVGQVLERALALKDVSYLAVSTVDLDSRFERRARPQGAATTADEASASTKVYARPSLTTEFQAPQSSIEEMLVAMWEELLGIRPIGVHDDFFELGGHSLLATLILGRVADLFPVRIEFHDIVNNPSVSKLAALIESLLLQKIEQMSDEEAARMLAALPQA